MIEYLNNHTVRLTPDTKRLSYRKRKPKPKPRGVVVGKPQRRGVPVRKPKRGKRTAWDRKITALAADAIRGAMDRELWLARQMRRSHEYELALERRGCTKGRGLGGWSCPSGTRVMRQDERLPF